MTQFIIAIDAGGTKTRGRITQTSDHAVWNARVEGASLTHHFEKSCHTIAQLVDMLISESGAKASECILACGAAGAGSDENKERLQSFLRKKLFSGRDEASKLAKVIVTTDARTWLYGAGAGKPIIVIALGTGSVSMRLNLDGSEHQFGGWGFISGDLGSGAELGRLLVSRCLVEFDRGEFSEHSLVAEAFKQIGTNRQQILGWLKNASASQYASLAPLVFKYQGKDIIAKKIVETCVDDVAELIAISQATESLPVCVIGGLASALERAIEQKIGYPLVSATGDALDGAYYLAKKAIE